MSLVTVQMSMSVDGFIAGPNDTADNPLGEGGDRLHRWIYTLESWRRQHGLQGGESGIDSEVIEESFANIGATVMGRRMFDFGERYWGEEPPFHCPVFVVTHRPRASEVKQGGTTYEFVTDGAEAALGRAREAAGDRDVSVAGGADVVQQYLRAGLIDQIELHVVPVLLGQGRRLFDQLPARQVELDQERVIPSGEVTHIRYRAMS